ncbi:hypothetical protein [Streptomyces canus]|uniref:hypothetical protein n=1 Tax=Streptomyces canus TaxID=58343 RepID=UPI002E26B900
MEPATYVRTASVPLAQLRPYPGNAKRGNVGAILESLCRNGQYRSVVARETDGEDTLTALAGNHTVQAIAAHGPGDCGMTVKIGDEERACGLCRNQPWEPVVRCEIVTCTDETALRINLVDNKSAEGTYDEAALAELIAPLDGDLGGTGYSAADVDDLVRAVAAAIEDEPDEDPYDDEDQDQAAEEQPATVPAGTPAPSSSAGPSFVIPAGPAPGTVAPPVPDGFRTMLLTYTVEDRDEAARLVSIARELFEAEAAAAIVLRALRTLVAVLDSRHAHDGVVTVSALLRAAGADR